MLPMQRRAPTTDPHQPKRPALQGHTSTSPLLQRAKGYSYHRTTTHQISPFASTGPRRTCGLPPSIHQCLSSIGGADRTPETALPCGGPSLCPRSIGGQAGGNHPITSNKATTLQPPHVSQGPTAARYKKNHAHLLPRPLHSPRVPAGGF